jgi:hypothetical protein
MTCTWWCEVARYVCYRFMQARFTAVVVLVILHRVSEVYGLTELKDMLPEVIVNCTALSIVSCLLSHCSVTSSGV